MADKFSTKAQLRQLSKWACVAYAVRCAQRVQPLFDLPQDEPKRDQHLLAVDRTIKLAAAGSASVIDANAATDAYAAATDAYAAYAANAAAYAANANLYANLYANFYANAYAAADAADAAAAYAANAAAYAADAAAAYAANAANDATVVRAVRLDFERLLALAGQSPQHIEQPLDVTDTGPLGPLWPEGPPSWYVERRAKLDAELARIAGKPADVSPPAQIAEPTDPDRLVIRVSLGEFAPIDEVAAELAKLYKALNAAHIAAGGQGLVVDDWKQYVEQGAPVAGGCL